eukprot:PhM_4_TR839/c0_g4_i1/m.59541
MSNNDSCIMCISANYLWCSIQHVCVVPSGSSPIGPSAECTDACTQTSSESCLGHESLKYCALTSTCTWGNDTTVACDRWTFPTPAPHHHTDPGGSTHHPGLGVILGACGGSRDHPFARRVLLRAASCTAGGGGAQTALTTNCHNKSDDKYWRRQQHDAAPR